MIDGIKIDCSYIDPEKWKVHPALKYMPRVDLETGEIPPQELTANANGLTFTIKPSTKEPGKMYLQIAGSLHRFHNEGNININNFTRTQISDTIALLNNSFGLEPEKSQFRNLEFGVNIQLPFSAQKFIKGIITMPGKKFGQMNIKRPSLGRVCVRSEYELKIYDKGTQCKQNCNNLLRVEMKVTKMRYLSKYGISTLSDLQNVNKLLALGWALLTLFGDVVFYDGSIDLGKLNDKERLALEEFTNPHRWLHLSRKARHDARNRMAKFFQQHGGTEPKNIVLWSIGKKWLELVQCPQKIGNVFTGVLQQLGADRKVTFSPLECTVKTLLIGDLQRDKKAIDIFAENPPISPPAPIPQNGHFQRTFCKTCQRDISHQRKSSLFCSPKHFGLTARKCRDTAWNQKRKAIRKAEREAKALKDKEHQKQ